ncbi:MAG: hydrolase [Elusimicrobiota bacterium]
MRYKTLLRRDQTLLVVIDIQEKLLGVYDPAVRERVVSEASRLVSGARVLGLPLVITEQYPKGIGPTHGAVRQAAGESFAPIEKSAFSCCGEKRFLEAVEATGRKQALVCGIEAHVCVQQTALDLLARDYQVYLCRDAVGSRKAEDYETALSRMRAEGAVVTTVESALFELLEACTDKRFKDILKIVK